MTATDRDPLDALLDRIGDLLALCSVADRSGRYVITTSTVRDCFRPGPGAPRPVARAKARR